MQRYRQTLLEEQGKTVTPGNVAYYVILHSKSGRRSTGSSRVDVMASQTQLCGVSAVHSFEEEIGLNEEFDGPCTLGELLSNTGDDPSMTAARNLDWEEFLDGADKRHRLMLGDLVDGNGAAKSLLKKNDIQNVPACVIIEAFVAGGKSFGIQSASGDRGRRPSSRRSARGRTCAEGKITQRDRNTKC